MLIRILLRWLVLAVAVGLSTWLVPDMTVTGGFLTYLWIALLLGIVNAFLGTILRIITLPLTVITLGLFALVVNAAVLGVTDWLSDSLNVDGIWSTFLAAIVISVVSTVLGLLVRDPL
jgi:putative membrane protein